MTDGDRTRRTAFATCLAMLVLAVQPSAQGGAKTAAGATSAPGAASGVPVVFEGIVLAPDGGPARGAVVVGSVGGRAVTDAGGRYRLVVEVPVDADRVAITAVGAAGTNETASRSVGLVAPLDSVPVAPLLLARGASSEPQWLPTFGGLPGTDRKIRALAVYDDGGGPALYAGGDFTVAGGVVASHVAKWDGERWSPLGTGMAGGFLTSVYALAVFDAGDGKELYAGGDFTTASGVTVRGIARWDGAHWRSLAGGVTGGLDSNVYALAVYDDGNGRALYAGGDFTSAGGVTARGIARWDGASWSALGTGVDGEVFALSVYDDGSGADLIVGGLLFDAGGVPDTVLVAQWDGASWSAIGGGIGGLLVNALGVYDDGGGPALYAAGNISLAGGVPVAGIARWDGSSWAALGSGVVGTIEALTTVDLGQGPVLLAGGGFVQAGGAPASGIATWNGTSWAAPDPGIDLGTDEEGVLAFAELDLGEGPELHVAGWFPRAGGRAANSIVTWDGTSWGALGDGIGGAPGSNVAALTVFDDGSGPALYVGGRFSGAGGETTNSIARWNGARWEALGEGCGNSFFGVRAMEVFDDGNGPALYAGGGFQTAGGLPADRIARWDGTSWTPLGSGLNGICKVLKVFDDGSESALYAGGNFTTAGGIPANAIARWDGTGWSPVGAGLGGYAGANVAALAVHDDGSGTALYAGGGFTASGGGSLANIARWDGASWISLGSGMNLSVNALAVYDDGGGPALHAGGFFSSAGGQPIIGIARWDGSIWSPVGNAISFGGVETLFPFDAGDGPMLYAGGNFNGLSGQPLRVARWNGTQWAALGSGVSARVLVLQAYADEGGPALYVGGEFATAFESGDSYLAKWGRPDAAPPELACPPSVFALADGPPAGVVVTFEVTATDNLDPSPAVVCTPPSGSVFPRGTTLVLCTATDASGNQATCSFPVTVEVDAARGNSTRR